MLREANKAAQTDRETLNRIIEGFSQWWANCVFIDPRIYEMRGHLPRRMRIEHLGKLAYLPFPHGTTVMREFVSDMLYSVEVLYREGLLEGRMYQHYILRTEQGDLSYMIDPAMYLTMKAAPMQMAHFVSESIIRLFAKHLKGDK